MAEMILKPKAGAQQLKPADIPKHIADGAARATLHAMTRYFDDPAIMADYKKWLKERNSKKRSDFIEN